ncbi:hypothetical protein CEE45_09225 [Candidatus Heimdallarchaeota archaeon B3_Heim]|nr:MAG: hypothetical protein CEE45_09225 [Candidatus Heimdallarchaeota archaeon B3_Heim]
MTKAFEVQDLRNLREEIVQLRDQKADLLSNLRKLEKERNQKREERDNLNKLASENFAKVRGLKDQRDKNNRSIQELKAVRRSVLEEMKELIEKAKSLQEEIVSMDITEQDIKKSYSLRKRIDSLDWKIQTTSRMGIAEERQLTEQVNMLMEQLGDISVSTEKLKARKEINREINHLRGFLDHSWKDFQELVENSQRSHQELTELYDTGKKAKDEADTCHKLFLERADEIRTLRDEFRGLNKSLREKSSIFREQNRAQKERVQLEREKASAEILEEQKAIIQEKLSSKKKKVLSIEEMRIMMSQDPDFLSNDDVLEEE